MLHVARGQNGTGFSGRGGNQGICELDAVFQVVLFDKCGGQVADGLVDRDRAKGVLLKESSYRGDLIPGARTLVKLHQGNDRDGPFVLTLQQARRFRMSAKKPD